MKRLLAVIALIISTNVTVNAAHMRGGEIIWRCITADNINSLNTQYNANFNANNIGMFVFIAKLYGDCSGSSSILNSYNVPFVISGYSGGGPSSFAPILVSATDISPNCYSTSLRWRCAPGFTSFQATGPMGGMGATAEFIFRSNPVRLNGSPPNNGSWTISMGPHCCRNNVTNMTGSPSFHLRTEMYPYPDVPNPRTHGQNPPFKDMFPCYDNSPEFLELPNVISCTGYEFTYGPLAFDRELDSIVYEWAPAQVGAGQSGPYTGQYTYDSPLPSTAPSVAAELDPVSGLITFESHQNGTYTTCMEARAYKCGIPVASIYRDVQIVTANCNQAYIESNITPPPNDPPSISFTSDTNRAAFTRTGNVWRTTILAGDTVEFTLNAQDFDMLPNGLFQTITFLAAGGQLGENWSSTTTGCNNPPCATILPGPGQSNFVTSLNNTVLFRWETACSHLAANVGCGVFSNEYVFYLKMEDNFCPTPARSLATIIIDIQAGVAPAPDLICASQLDDGNVELTVVPPVDTGYNFNFFIISEASNPNGPYTVIDSTYQWNVSSIITTPVLSGERYYQIQSNTGCNYTSSPSRRVGIINLNLTPSPPTSSEVGQLRWNRQIEGDTSLIYNVYAEIPEGSGNWSLITSTTDTAFDHPANFCGIDIAYRVETEKEDSTQTINCTSVSNIVSGYFSDETNTDTIQIELVTVDENGLAEIHFGPSPSGDVIAYYILHQNDSTGEWDIIDSVSSADPYTWADSEAANRVERFKVISIDSCGNVSDSTLAIHHNTLIISESVDACGGVANLSWNHHEGWGNELLGYEIRVDIDDKDGTITPDVFVTRVGPNDTSAVHELSYGFAYCYTVYALHEDSIREAASYELCVDPDVPNRSEMMYISKTEVRGDGIYLQAFADGTADVQLIRIERANSPNSRFYEIAEIELPVNPPYTFTYVDYLADPNKNIYYYRLVAVDTCSGIDTISNLATNIRVQVEPKRNEQNWISWNPYRDFAGGVANYALYRVEDDRRPPELITDQIPGTDTLYIDNIRSFPDDHRRFCYEVRAIEGPNPLAIPTGFGNFVSISNHNCTHQKPKLLIPNAFNPSSTNPRNRTWGVRDRFLDYGRFELVVLDRWGKIVFETNDPANEWDGTMGGNEAPMGVHSYFIRYSGEGGYVEELRGTFTLMR